MAQTTFDHSRLPRRRVGSGCLFVDHEGRPLLVEPTYKPTWEIPGGVVEGGEDPRTCVTREVQEELGLTVTPGRLLVIDHQADPPPRGDSMMLIYDGGLMEHPETIHLRETELRSFRFVPVEALDQFASERLAFRVRQALRAWREGTMVEIVNGQVI